MENQKKCTQCGELIPSDSQFCWSYGATQSKPALTGVAAPQGQAPERSTGIPISKNLLIVVLAILLCLSLLCCAVFAYPAIEDFLWDFWNALP